jgi:hypothetical protein
MRRYGRVIQYDSGRFCATERCNALNVKNDAFRDRRAFLTGDRDQLRTWLWLPDPDAAHYRLLQLLHRDPDHQKEKREQREREEDTYDLIERIVGKLHR